MLINEILARTAAPLEDAIELFNPTSTDIAIGGWYLSDSRDSRAALKKYRLPEGLVLPAGGHQVVFESAFNPGAAVPGSFALNGAGDEVFLSSADEDSGELTGYITGMRFSALAAGVSYGRVDTSGGADLAPLGEPSLGAENPGHLAGPVIISEVHYHPARGDSEFIELYNAGQTPVDLAGYQIPDGNPFSAFTVPGPFTLQPGAYGLLVANQAEFLNHYGQHLAPQIIAQWGDGQLSNNGEIITVRDADGAVVTSFSYDDRAPWPEAADGELTFDAIFEPMRPMTASVHLVIKRRTGGRWPFEVQLDAREPDPDDLIEIESNLHATSKVQFRLTNTMSTEYTPFSAFFSTDSAHALSVSPSHGLLAPIGTAEGTMFEVAFNPTKCLAARTSTPRRASRNFSSHNARP